MSVNLLLPLSTRQKRVAHIYHYALVSKLIVTHLVTWLVLSSDQQADHDSHATQGNPLGVEEVVGSSVLVDRHIATLRITDWNVSVHISILQVVGHHWKSMPNVGVERDLGNLFVVYRRLHSLVIHSFHSVWLDLVFFSLLQHAGELYFLWLLVLQWLLLHFKVDTGIHPTNFNVWVVRRIVIEAFASEVSGAHGQERHALDIEKMGL